jgi:hypothetical protein
MLLDGPAIGTARSLVAQLDLLVNGRLPRSGIGDRGSKKENYEDEAKVLNLEHSSSSTCCHWSRRCASRSKAGAPDC